MRYDDLQKHFRHLVQYNESTSAHMKPQWEPALQLVPSRAVNVQELSGGKQACSTQLLIFMQQHQCHLHVLPGKSHRSELQ
jgi:hypothetical protein